MKITKNTAESIVEEIGTAIGKDVNLMDDEGHIIASTDPGRIGTRHGGAKRIVEQKLDSLTIHSDEEYAGAKTGINLPLYFQEEIIGVIGITGNWDEIGRYQKLIKKISEVLLFDAYLKEQELYSQAEVGEYVRQWLFEDPQRLRGDFLQSGKNIGIDTAEPWRVGVLSLLHTDPMMTESAFQTLRVKAEDTVRRLPSTIGRVIVFGHFSNIILLLPDISDEGLETYAKQVMGALERQGGCGYILGFDEGAGTGFALRDGYHKADLALRAAFSAGPGNYRFYQDVMLEIILYDIPQNLKRDYLAKLFAGVPRKEMDQWLELLQVFYKCEGSITKTAQQLYLHKNTLQYQLKKIASQLGYDPRNISNAALFQIAIAFSQDKPPRFGPIAQKDGIHF